MQQSEIAEEYAKHADDLLRFAATHVGPSHAEDVVASALLSVLRSDSAHVTDMKNYLYRSVANAGAKHWRSLDRRLRREALVVRPDQIEDDYRCPQTRAALNALSPQQRAVIHLTYWEDLAVAEVAERLNVSDGTVRRQLARARAKLKGLIS